MRTMSVLILVTVAAMLIVAGTGNAFATTWYSNNNGYDNSQMVIVNSPAFTTVVDQSLTLSSKDSLGWHNYWYNGLSSLSILAGYQYSSGYAGGATFYGSTIMTHGTSTSADIITSAIVPPQHGVSDTININHIYEVDGYAYWHGTDFSQKQKYYYS